jgi:hypothetical protein
LLELLLFYVVPASPWEFSLLGAFVAPSLLVSLQLSYVVPLLLLSCLLILMEGLNKLLDKNISIVFMFLIKVFNPLA